MQTCCCSLAGTEACKNCASKQTQAHMSLQDQLTWYVGSKQYVEQPIGIIPKDAYKQQRINDIRAAIKRYMYSRQQIPVEWIEEYNEIVKQEQRGIEIQTMYIGKLKQQCFTGDIESDHGKADDIIGELLIELGMNELKEVYDKVDKWYA